MEKYCLHPKSIQRLFDSVAPRYDFLNHLLSMRRDICWRRVAVQELRGLNGWILDNATGTGDVAFELLRHGDSGRRIAGLDFSEPMIRIAHRKVLSQHREGEVFLSLGDALSLPFPDNTFSASMTAFGLRNIPEKEKALSEMVRVTRHGGKVVLLEFTLPRHGWMRWIYPFYFTRILPWVGGLISGDRAAYRYLPESVLWFQTSEDYARLMRQCGLEQLQCRSLTSGIASLFVGTKNTS
jgi:demethylmenaquinone methyltransferase/2-methoxy-6-polyprenyl-1,4-benzoquinol methylase